MLGEFRRSSDNQLAVTCSDVIEQLENASICWKNVVVGTVKNVGYDFPHCYGDFIPSSASHPFKELFQFLMGADAGGDPPFDQELLDEENWFVQRVDGEREKMTLPSIDYSDGTVDWRPR
ncbi:hypothetical protein CA13_00170 [Planctomycetes bacterium CA13]|uniref:Uncharacterized protein n=1 Tax=Novipirellula herctigrandis TaxID=2527986 RepID=A0A5C5YUY0_9BACT|nr:hypothetical protein CA13_00170 [Planctomycetes bacterium CA13]